jgi:hypothetical protein
MKLGTRGTPRPPSVNDPVVVDPDHPDTFGTDENDVVQTDG